MANNESFGSQAERSDGPSDFAIIWQRFRWLFIGLVVAVILGVAVNEVLRKRAEASAMARFDAIDNSQFDSIENIEKSGLARLAYANALITQGSSEEAIATLDAIISNNQFDDIVIERARLTRATLGDDAVASGAGHYIAVERLIEIDRLLGAGDDVAALAKIQALVDENPAAIAPWVETLLLELGGVLPDPLGLDDLASGDEHITDNTPDTETKNADD